MKTRRMRTTRVRESEDDDQEEAKDGKTAVSKKEEKKREREWLEAHFITVTRTNEGGVGTSPSYSPTKSSFQRKS